MKKQVITIVGGGSSAHVLIPFLTSPEREINLLTSRPREWKKELAVEWQRSNGDVIKTFHGNLDKVSSSPEDVVPTADIIIFCMPVYCYRDALGNIAGHINRDKKVVIGTIYGQGGFNWMVDEIRKNSGLTNLKTFAIGLIPWIARIREYGKIGITYGPKAVNVVAFDDKNEFSNLRDLFNDICFKYFNKGKFELADNFLSLTLSVDNQIIHTSRLFGLYKRYGGTWEKLEEVPYFYRDYDDLSADLLRDLDNDYSRIRNRIVELYPDRNFQYMLNYLDLERFSYKSCSEDIKGSFVNSETLGAIKTPVVEKEGLYRINTDHRFFYDDMYYGLCIAKWVAQCMDIEVSTIDAIMTWAEKMLDDRMLEDAGLFKQNKKMGIPSLYGYRSLDDIVD